MHFYHLKTDEVLALPLKTFWFMANSIDRILAKSELRGFGSALAAQSTPQGVSAHHERLVLEIGTTVKTSKVLTVAPEAKRDEQGFSALKQMASQKPG